TGSERELPINARKLGPADPQERVEISVYLRDPSGTSLVDGIDAHASQPGPQISREAYIAQHSADPEDLAKVEAFARAHHLSVVSVNPAERKVALTGTAGQLAATFATELHEYEQDGTTFRGRTGHLHVPQELEPIITGIFGLDDRPQATTHFRFLSQN